MSKIKLRLSTQDKVLVLGRARSGKTTLLKALLPGIKRAVVYDCNNEFKSGIQAVAVNDSLTLADRLEIRDHKIRFYSENERDFGRVCRCVRGAAEDGFFSGFFLVDEVNLFCSPEKISDPFKWLIRFGRHHHIGLIYSTQRAPDLHKLLRSQSNKFFLFSQHDPQDVEFLRGYVPDRDKILSLQEHHFLYYDQSRAQIGTVDDLSFT